MKSAKIIDIENSKNIALLDTSSISFMHYLHQQGINIEKILDDYDIILIPNWVFVEIEDSLSRMEYLNNLAELEYPIYKINETDYTSLANHEEGHLYNVVLASTNRLSAIKSYLRRYVQKKDLLDLDSYIDWINNLYNNWPIQGDLLTSGRLRKKNAGEISITILAEVLS